MPIPPTIDDLNNIPVKFVNGATVFVKDVGQVHDGNAVQQNIVRADGRRSVLLSIIKNGNASTLGGRQRRQAGAGHGAGGGAARACVIKELFDQSVFVTRLDRRPAARRRHRRRPHRADDRAVSRLLALDARRHDLDPAVDPVLARRAVLPRRHHQHHDAGRARAGDRHPGRRLHGDDREHPSPADRRSTCRCRRRRCTAPPRSRCRRWSRRWRSVACSSRWCFFTARRSTCSRRSASPWCSRCWRPTRFSRTLTPITIGLLLKNERTAPRPATAGLRACSHRFERGFERMRGRLCRDPALTLLDAPADRPGGRGR